MLEAVAEDRLGRHLGDPPEGPGSDPAAKDDAAAALHDLPADAPLGAVWAALGARGTLSAAYRRRGAELGLVPERLHGILNALDQRGQTGVTLGACVQLATAIPLLADGTSAPAVQALRATMSGTSVTALAATDGAAAGSDLSALGTRVEIAGGRLTVSGHKRWITNAVTCDQILVLARHRPGRHFTSFAWVLVPREAEGVRIRSAGTRMFDGAGLGDIDFLDVSLPADHLVGRPGRGMTSFARHITRERLAGAIWAAALSRRVLRAAHARLGDRCSGDGELWSLAPLRQRLAAGIVEVRLLEALTCELEQRIVTSYDPAAAALLKAAAAGVTARVLDHCASLEGADGYLTGHTQELRAEAAVFGIGGGTTDIMLDTIADHASALLNRDRP